MTTHPSAWGQTDDDDPTWPEPAPDPDEEPAESLDDDGTPGAPPPAKGRKT